MSSITGGMLRDLIASRDGVVPEWDQDKREGYAIADELEIPRPRVLLGPFGHDDWPERGPDVSCVLKPLDASNVRGVVPLIRLESLTSVNWWSVWDGEGRTWSGWRGWSIVEQDRHRWRGIEPYSGPWVAEELIRGEHSEGLIDWKCYTIRGRVAFVRQILRTGRRHRDCRVCCWTRAFDRIPYDVVAQEARPVDLSLPGPLSPARIVEIAEAVAAYLEDIHGNPFARIDVIEDGTFGPMLGEITAHPAGGRQDYLEPWDSHMAEGWGCEWPEGAETLERTLTRLDRTLGENMDKIPVPDCHHCGKSHKALTVKELDNPLPMLRLRVRGFATCPATKLPIPVYDHSDGRERVPGPGFLGHV